MDGPLQQKEKVCYENIIGYFKQIKPKIQEKDATYILFEYLLVSLYSRLFQAKGLILCKWSCTKSTFDKFG